MHWRPSQWLLFLHAGCGLRVATGQYPFPAFPLLSCSFIGHAVWVLFLLPRNQRPCACSIATWTCAAPSYSTTWGWDPRWWWGCENTCVITMVSKVLEEQSVADSIVEFSCSFLLLGESTKQLQAVLTWEGCTACSGRLRGMLAGLKNKGCWNVLACHKAVVSHELCPEFEVIKGILQIVSLLVIQLEVY